MQSKIDFAYYLRTYAGVGPCEAMSIIRSLGCAQTSVLVQRNNKTYLKRLADLSVHGAKFASDIRFEFEGGPPNGWKWYKGTLESFLIDCFLQDDVRYGKNISRKRPGQASETLSA